MDNDRNGSDNRQNPEPREPGNMSFNFKNNRFALFFLVAIVSMFIVLLFTDTGEPANEIPYSQFLSHLEAGEVESVTIMDETEISGSFRTADGERSEFRTHIPYFDAELVGQLREHDVRFTGKERPVSPFRMVLEFLPWFIIFFFIFFMFRQVQGSGNKAFSFGRSKAKRFVDEGSKLTFADVAGHREAKYELEEVVEFLKSPDKFTKIGAKIPKGVLLVGGPGTGKTLLAKACAGEANVAFFHMSGSDFVEMFVGVGASRVRDLFDQGRKNAPCLLFIDELDAVGRTRGAGYGGGHDEREQTLNQMLVEMDGFESKEGVIIIAATNRPDVLDPALLRPGRFDRQVVIDMPDMKEREDILRLHCKHLPIADDVDLERVARATPGSSGADLANLINEAALYAARKDKTHVDMEDFEQARDKLLMGVERKSRLITEEDKRKTAYHESGHALMHYYCRHADPLHKVTIVPRGRALGLALSLPERDEYSKARGWLEDRIKIAYGGYVAEQLVYNETTTGVQNDLKQATDLARRMVTEWGMSEIGPVAFGQEDEPIFIGKEIAQHKEYSESTAQAIDAEIKRILTDNMNITRRILEDHREQLDTLAAALQDKETLSDFEVRELLGFELPPKSGDGKRSVKQADPVEQDEAAESAGSNGGSGAPADAGGDGTVSGVSAAAGEELHDDGSSKDQGNSDGEGDSDSRKGATRERRARERGDQQQD